MPSSHLEEGTVGLLSETPRHACASHVLRDSCYPPSPALTDLEAEGALRAAGPPPPGTGVSAACTGRREPGGDWD